MSSGIDAKSRLTESHDMNRFTPNSPAVAVSPCRRSMCLNRVAPLIIDTITVAIRSRTSGALLLFSLIGHVSTRRSKNPPAFANWLKSAACAFTLICVSSSHFRA